MIVKCINNITYEFELIGLNDKDGDPIISNYYNNIREKCSYSIDVDECYNVYAIATIGATAIGTAGMVIGGMSGKEDWSWENASQGFMVGSITGAIIGGAWGGAHYALQSAGEMAIRTNINNLVNNPLDEFVTVGPKDGCVSNYVRSISQTGNYGQIYANKLSNGMYQIANGHHRVAALRQLGYQHVNFFLVP